MFSKYFRLMAVFSLFFINNCGAMERKGEEPEEPMVTDEGFVLTKEPDGDKKAEFFLTIDPELVGELGGFDLHRLLLNRVLTKMEQRYKQMRRQKIHFILDNFDTFKKLQQTYYQTMEENCKTVAELISELWIKTGIAEQSDEDKAIDEKTMNINLFIDSVIAQKISDEKVPELVSQFAEQMQALKARQNNLGGALDFCSEDSLKKLIALRRKQDEEFIMRYSKGNAECKAKIKKFAKGEVASFESNLKQMAEDYAFSFDTIRYFFTKNIRIQMAEKKRIEFKVEKKWLKAQESKKE